MLPLVLGAAVILTIAYFTYGSVLTRLLRLDAKAKTPAEVLRDDVDYVPINPGPLLGQHFSAIAAAGPIVGPILAGVLFGWAPAFLWILVGAIFIGGVHDMTALVSSIRHKALSIAVVVRQNMSQRAFLLFLSFVWLALVYIIVAFTDITAASFVGKQELENGKIVTGAGIASSSLMYLALPIIMGLLVRYTGMSMGRATLIFLPLVGVAIWLGQKLPVDLTALLQTVYPEATDKTAHKAWDILLLIYCCIASVVPMWALLQPRGALGGYFLYAVLGAGAIGLLLGGKPIQYPAFIGWTAANGHTLFPMLFITIACGACSGFHSLIASGTTSKQLRRETDARVIGYGAMLLEAMVAVVSLCCVMMLAPNSPLVQPQNLKPNYIYALGIGGFLDKVGIPTEVGIAFALMAFTTFVYDTLDVCTRLGRYIIQELTGWQDAKGKWLGTLLTGGAPMLFVMQTTYAKGVEVPIWRKFWDLFGASNQLLAALTLLGVTIWLWRTRRARWVWLVTGIPTVWMYAMSSWALARSIDGSLQDALTKWPAARSVWTQVGDGGVSFWDAMKETLGVVADPVGWIAVVLVVLAALMLIEAVRILLSLREGGSPPDLQSVGRLSQAT